MENILFKSAQGFWEG